MKKYKVPILTEEYSIEVRLGSIKKCLESASKYLGVSYKAIERDFGNCRGRAWNALDKEYGVQNPIIVINADLPYHIAIATLAHEASHAVSFIEDFVGIRDEEFRAHGIAAVMRIVGNSMKPKG